LQGLSDTLEPECVVNWDDIHGPERGYEGRPNGTG